MTPQAAGYGAAGNEPDSPHLQLRVDAPVATLVLDRPAKRNAISLAMWSALPALVARAAADPEVRVLVVTGAAPGLFSAGADIAEFPALRSSVAAGRRYSATIRAGQDAIADSGVPTVAAISGPCLGGGCGIALACDLRIADDTARLGIPAARLGVVYSLPSTKRLVDVVGGPWARQLLLTAEPVDAAVALRIGLVNEVCAPEALPARVASVAARIAAAAPQTVRAARGFIAQALAGAVADDAACQATYDAAYVAPEYSTRVRAFLDRPGRAASGPAAPG